MFVNVGLDDQSWTQAVKKTTEISMQKMFISALCGTLQINVSRNCTQWCNHAMDHPHPHPHPRDEMVSDTKQHLHSGIKFHSFTWSSWLTVALLLQWKDRMGAHRWQMTQHYLFLATERRCCGDGFVGQLVCWSHTLAQSQIPQQLLKKPFMVPRKSQSQWVKLSTCLTHFYSFHTENSRLLPLKQRLWKLWDWTKR